MSQLIVHLRAHRQLSIWSGPATPVLKWNERHSIRGIDATGLTAVVGLEVYDRTFSS